MDYNPTGRHEAVKKAWVTRKLHHVTSAISTHNTEPASGQDNMVAKQMNSDFKSAMKQSRGSLGGLRMNKADRQTYKATKATGASVAASRASDRAAGWNRY